MSAFFLNLLNMSISASFIVLVIILLRLIFKNVPKYIFCILWGFVAIRLICPFSLGSSLSLIPNSQEIEKALLRNSVNKNIPNDVLDNLQQSDDYIFIDNNDNIESVDNSDKLVNNLPSAIENVKSESPIFARYTVDLIWLLGVFIILLYSVICYIRLKNEVRASIKIKENILICDNIKTPFILGIFNPKIYLPSDMNQEEQNYVLLHENAHLKRLDNFWKPFGFLLLSIHWFNPLIWLAYVLFCNDIEFATDEKVIRKLNDAGKKEYSEMLLLFSIENSKFISACPVAFGEVSVKERIKKVLNYKSPSFFILLLSILICVFVAIFFLTTHKENIIPVGNIENSNNEEIYNLEFGIVDNITDVSENALNVDIFNLSGDTQSLLLYGFKNISKNDVIIYAYEEDKIIYFIKFKNIANKVIDITNNSIKLDDNSQYLFNGNDDYIIACLEFSDMFNKYSFYESKNILDIDKENDKVNIQKYGDKYYIIVYKNRVSDKEKNTPSTAINLGDENFNRVWDIMKNGYFEEMSEEYNDMKKISIDEAINIALEKRIGTDNNYSRDDINARYLLYTNFYSEDVKRKPVVLITIDETNTKNYKGTGNPPEDAFMKTLVIIDSVTGEDLSLTYICYNEIPKENTVYSYKDIVINSEELNNDESVLFKAAMPIINAYNKYYDIANKRVYNVVTDNKGGITSKEYFLELTLTLQYETATKLPQIQGIMKALNLNDNNLKTKELIEKINESEFINQYAKDIQPIISMDIGDLTEEKMNSLKETLHFDETDTTFEEAVSQSVAEMVVKNVTTFLEDLENEDIGQETKVNFGIRIELDENGDITKTEYLDYDTYTEDINIYLPSSNDEMIQNGINQVNSYIENAMQSIIK